MYCIYSQAEKQRKTQTPLGVNQRSFRGRKVAGPRLASAASRIEIGVVDYRGPFSNFGKAGQRKFIVFRLA